MTPEVALVLLALTYVAGAVATVWHWLTSDSLPLFA